MKLFRSGSGGGECGEALFLSGATADLSATDIKRFACAAGLWFFWTNGRQWRIVHPMRKPITVAETPLFVKQADAVWSGEERLEFIDFIAENPDAGDLTPGTGGIRKLRWSRAGSGKRGGVRVAYFYYDEERPLYLLMVYAKARKENLTPDEARILRNIAAAIVGK